jgi:hypothetical protein
VFVYDSSGKTTDKHNLIRKNEFDRIAKVWIFPNLFLCLARVISLSGHLSGSIFILKSVFRHIYANKISRGGDITSTQNLLISFRPIIFKLNYSHVMKKYAIYFLINQGDINYRHENNQCLNGALFVTRSTDNSNESWKEKNMAFLLNFYD